jgi:hypothetical protein
MKAIGGAIAGGIKQIAPAILKAVAPAASKLLSGIVGDTFKMGGAMLQKLASALPGPLASIGQKLLGKGMDMLKNLQGGVEKGLNNILQSITQRFLPGLGNVALPSTTSPERQKGFDFGQMLLSGLTGGLSNLVQAGIGAVQGAIAGATGGTHGAAPAGPSAPSGNAAPPPPSSGSSSSAATGNANQSIGAQNAAKNPNVPPKPGDFGDLKDNNNMQALLDARQAYQDARQTMLDSAKFMSDIIKAGQETLKAIAQNVR